MGGVRFVCGGEALDVMRASHPREVARAYGNQRSETPVRSTLPGFFLNSQ